MILGDFISGMEGRAQESVFLAADKIIFCIIRRLQSYLHGNFLT